MITHLNRKRWRGVQCLSAFAACAALGVANVNAQSATLAFSQLDLFLDDGSHPFSDWGAIDMQFSGSPSLQYLNVSVNGSWQVQNIPVLSIEGLSPQTMTYNFDIGTNGVPYVGSLSYGFSLTTTPLDNSMLTNAPVENAFQLSVPTQQVIEHVGEMGDANQIQYSAASALIGAAVGGVVGAAKKAAPGFPNQEAGVDECVPVAVSNSLQYLNAKHNLGIAAADITIAKMKTATGWTANGCPAGWWNTKDAYMKANGIPIMTTTTMDPAVAAQKLMDMCDVELGSPNHRAAVVGISNVGNGMWSIDVAHDTMQGMAGGTKVETVKYNTATGKLTGATFFNNVNFRNFVVECPVPEPSSLGLIAVGLVATTLTRRRSVQT